MTTPTPESTLDKLRRWWRMSGTPHICQDCGDPMSARQNGAGLWIACCPRMWITFSDTTYEHNYSGHSVARLSGPPLWGNCGHEHETTDPLMG